MLDLKARDWTYAAVGGLAVMMTLLTGCASTEEAPTSEANMEWAANMQSCMNEGGWDIEVRPDGGISANYADDQASAFNAAYAECETKFGYDVAPTYTDDEIKAIYAKVVDTAACITEQGYDPGEPPTEQTFIDQVRGDGGWDPYIDLYVPGGLTDDEYFALLEECPRTW